MGTRTVLVQDPRRRRPDDQRPRGDRAREALLPPRAFVQRRCILPADGYYEWVTGAEERQLEEKKGRKRPRKQPYFVTADGSVFAMAGLYEFWRDTTLPGDHEKAPGG